MVVRGGSNMTGQRLTGQRLTGERLTGQADGSAADGPKLTGQRLTGQKTAGPMATLHLETAHGMIRLPGGSFVMGSARARPARQADGRSPCIVCGWSRFGSTPLRSRTGNFNVLSSRPNIKPMPSAPGTRWSSIAS